MPLSLIGRTPTAAADLGRVDVPSSPLPPGEGLDVQLYEPTRPMHPGIGPRDAPPSLFETRAPMRRRNDYTRRQDLGQTWTNDGGRVSVVRRDSTVPGDQDPTGNPQRPTFRTRPGIWTDGLVDRDQD